MRQPEGPRGELRMTQVYEGVCIMRATQTNTQQEVSGTNEKISLGKLSELTGFPEDFIQKELMLNGENFSIEALRETMLSYLETSMGEEVKSL